MTLAAPVVLVLAVAALGANASAVRQLEFNDALVNTAIVVALYVFIGNSGVLSFGHMSFVAIGAYLSGILTLGAEQKNFVLPAHVPGAPAHARLDADVARARRARRRRLRAARPGSR